ncbi:AraC family transcriptional regulator [Rhodovastum atsumiense]|uniref:AraC family transcriptional regulator n=1 Tax=Rhodovastum atsumiense TaxID=504468 RepID=A0A5M6IKW1_9PROT|nr:AraC family transcriptional regulator [Rhodovastum atsumiense]
MLEGKLSLAARNASEPLIVAVADARQAIRSTELHSHARGQITAIRRGVVTAGTETEAWVVPPDHAVWMPPHQLHFGYSHGLFDSWSCYVAEPSCAGLPERPCTIRASGLLREAVLHAASWQDPVLDERRLRVALIILDELHAAPVESFSLPMPKDPRLLRIARALLNDPGDRRGMDAWASWAAVSERTLSRRFAAETGYSYTAWRQRVRLMRSLELLADGAPVTTVALDLGYDSVSAFIALFRRTLGMTPSAYFGRYQR